MNNIHLTQEEIDKIVKSTSVRYASHVSLREYLQRDKDILHHKVHEENFYDEDTTGRLKQKLTEIEINLDIMNGSNPKNIAETYNISYTELKERYKNALKRDPKKTRVAKNLEGLLIDILHEPKEAITFFRELSGMIQSEYSDLCRSVGDHAGDPDPEIGLYRTIAYNLESKLEKQEFENWKKQRGKTNY